MSGGSGLGGLGGAAAVVFDGFDEVGRGDGFGEVVVHAGVEAAFAVAVHGVGGHGDDGELFPAVVGADGAGGFDTVEFGHLDVHEDEVVVAGGEGFEGLFAVGGDVDDVAAFAEDGGDDLLVDEVVFGEEDAEAGEGVGEVGVGIGAHGGGAFGGGGGAFEGG